ncbi:MAG: hypothetical protein RLZZ272_1097, partial [Actinomycetota bacterium]
LDGAPAARALHDDGPGHPVAFARASLAPLTVLEGDVGAREVLGGLGVVDVDVEGDAPTDVDTPEDLARLLGSAPSDIDEHGSGR